jgi:hypothetical protein
MPTVDQRLKHVTLKLSRAHAHLSALQEQQRAFFATTPYKVGAKVAADRKPVYFVASADPVPDSIALIAGDAIQNLMSALDHLAYQLVCRDTGDNPPNSRGIYFPIADDAASYEAAKKRKMEGARPATIAAVDAVRPYKGGNDPLWQLHRLNNVEKHRLLLTVGSQAGGVNISQIMANVPGNPFPPEAAAALASMRTFLMPADKGFPLEPGFELYIGGVDEQINPKQEFAFDIAINEPGILEGGPLLKTLKALTNATEAAVKALEPALK